MALIYGKAEAARGSVGVVGMPTAIPHSSKYRLQLTDCQRCYSTTCRTKLACVPVASARLTRPMGNSLLVSVLQLFRHDLTSVAIMQL